MAYVKVKRPALSLLEKLYLPALFVGMGITLRHAFGILTRRKKVTMEYPEEKWDAQLPAYYRGAPGLVTDEQGRERCVACQLCEFICPPRAIEIHPEEIQPGDRWAKVEKRPRTFEINMLRCIYCGLCEEVCPEQAIFLGKQYVFTGVGRQELVHDKRKLYEIGSRRTGLVNKWNEFK